MNIGSYITVFDLFYTKPDSTFSHWNTAADGSGISYYPGQTILVTGDITLYAQWKANQSHMLIYNPNGGVGNVVIDMADSNGRVTIQNQNYFRNGYTFAGWNTMFDGSGVQYYPGQFIILDNNLFLHAQWEPTTSYYTVTYNPGIGGMGGHVDPGLIDGSRYTIKNPQVAAVARPWSIFDKWNTAADGSGATYVPGQSITITDNLTLYAIWYDY